MRVGAGKNAQEAKRRNIEIINNLKQTLSKPTIVQAQRTLKIMEKLIDRIGIFLNVDSDFIVKFNEVNNPQKLKINKTLLQELSPEVLDLAVKQAKLQLEFRSYASLQLQLKEGEIIEDQKIQQYNRVKKDMQYNFKSLIRALEKHSNDIETLKNLKMGSTINNQNSEGYNIYEALSNYKVIMQKTLATAAQQQESHTRLIEELQLKIASLEKTKANCQNELTRLKQDRAKHAQEKKQEMDKLKSQIREIKKNKELQMEKINKESKAMSDALLKDNKTKEQKLRSQINTQKLKLQKLRDENTKTEKKLKDDKAGSQTQLVQSITAYDKDMFTLNQTKNEAERQLKRITDELNNLKRHFSQIQQERKREQAILLADKKRKQEWQMVQKKRGEAATKIKEAYRLFKQKNKKKKKKPKK